MRKPSLCSNTEIIDVMTSNQPSNESGESRIERMRKFLSSPLTRKRSPVNHTNSKVFGTPLDILIQKNSLEAPVPHIITRICQYIEKTGLSQEGLFRISGNARLIERLKASFDQTGDAPLETEGDVASAAALLKLFLRELPEPLIPSSMHQAFLNAAKINGQSKDECINQLKNLVQRLPLPNLNVLRYLSCFLVSVSHHEEENRMNASALGIVFGPNLFRVAEDFKGLKEQSLTNQIVTYFISDYHLIFDSDIENSISQVDTIGGEEQLISFNNNACIGLQPSSTSTSKTRLYPSSLGHMTDMEPLSVVIPSVDNALLMLASDKEFLPDRRSPFLMVNSLVEETINRTITEHLYSDEKIHHEESNGFPVQSGRKRKDQKSAEDESFISHDIAENVCSGSESTLKMDHLTTDAHYIDDTNGYKHSEKHEQDIRKYTLDDAHSLLVDVLTHQDFRILSPRPPKPKRREVDSLSTAEPVLDPHAVLSSSGDFGFHEAQRSIERLTPRSSRSQFVPKSVYYQRMSSSFEEGSSGKTKDRNKTELPRVQDHSGERSSWYHGSHSVDVQYARDVESDSSLLKQNASVILVNNKTEKVLSEQESSLECMEESFIRVSPSELPSGDFEQSSVDKTSITDKQYDASEVRYVPGVVKSVDISDTSDIMKDSLLSDCSAEDFRDIEQSSSEHRFSWPILKNAPEDTTLSPCPNHLRKTNSFEASLSPSAYKSYLTHRSEHFDPSLPPSPPVEQEDFVKSSCSDETVTFSIKFLTKKIHSLKKKIKQFDETYEMAHGYRPSLAEKMNYPDMKKIITELNKTRKELKRLKEEGDLMDMPAESAVSRLGQPCVCSEMPNTKSTTTVKVAEGHGIIGKDVRRKCTVEESLKETLRSLREKRHVSERPEELEEMTKEQVAEEKVAIQKALLRFESVHGRPSSKEDRDLMRPLYDRYRNVKRIISKSGYQSGAASKIKDSLAELQPILEHVAMDFRTPEAKKDEPSLPAKGDSPDLHATDRPDDSLQDEKQADTQTDNDVNRNIPQETAHGSNLHELPLPELIRQQQYAKSEKHRLRRILRDFEEQFQKQTGRKLQKEDRTPMEAIYIEYKHVKAQLKLLEALLSKHEQHLI